MFTSIDNEHSVFTWRHTSSEQINKGIWKFLPTGEKNVFNIKNIFYNEYMYGSNNFLLHDNNLFRRRIYTCNCNSIDDKNFNWYISHEGNNKFALKNQGTNDYLYASSNDNRVHGIHATVNWVLGTTKIEGVWDLDCYDKIVSI